MTTAEYERNVKALIDAVLNYGANQGQYLPLDRGTFAQGEKDGDEWCQVIMGIVRDGVGLSVIRKRLGDDYQTADFHWKVEHSTKHHSRFIVTRRAAEVKPLAKEENASFDDALLLSAFRHLESLCRARGLLGRAV